MALRCVAVLLLCASTISVSADVDDATGLIKNPGWQKVRTHCGGCHSHALVTAQRADRKTWLEIIRWMQETQNLWQFEPDTEAEILDYLASNYPPAPNQRRAPLPPHLRPAPESSLDNAAVQ